MTSGSRRGVLLGGLTLAALAACGRAPADPAEPPPKPTLSEPVAPVHDQIEALGRRHNAKIGVYAVDEKTGRSVSYLDGERFAICSTFKGYAAARVLQKAELGELNLDEAVFVDPAVVVANSLITGPAAGRTLTLSELCIAALQRSDNTAGNMLLKAIGGPPAITAFARSIGDPETRLDRWEVELNSAIPGDLRDTSTPRAIGGGYRNLLIGDALGASARAQLEEWMRGNQTSSARAGLPQGWTTADKTGSGDYGSTNDIGIAYGPDGRKILLAIMTRSLADDPKAENLRPLIGELTAAALPWLIQS